MCSAVSTRKMFHASNCSHNCIPIMCFNLQCCYVFCQTGKVHTDGPGDMTPDFADFLFGYPTSCGYVACRDDEKGAWYISKLVEMLERYHKRLLLYTVTLLYNKTVLLNFEQMIRNIDIFIVEMLD